MPTVNQLAVNHPALAFVNAMQPEYVASLVKNLGSKFGSVTASPADAANRLRALVAAAQISSDYNAFVAAVYANAYQSDNLNRMMESGEAYLQGNQSLWPDEILGNPREMQSILAAFRKQMVDARACMSTARMEGVPDKSLGVNPKSSTEQQQIKSATNIRFYTGDGGSSSTSSGGTGKYANFLEQTLGFLEGLSAFGDKTVEQYQAFQAPAPTTPPVETKSDNTLLYVLGGVAVLLVGGLIYVALK